MGHQLTSTPSSWNTCPPTTNPTAPSRSTDSDLRNSLRLTLSSRTTTAKTAHPSPSVTTRCPTGLRPNTRDSSDTRPSPTPSSARLPPSTSRSPPQLTGVPRVVLPPSRTKVSADLAGHSPLLEQWRDSTSTRMENSSPSQSQYATKHGMFLEKDWPYKAVNGNCSQETPTTAQPTTFMTTGAQAISTNSVDALKGGLEQGPVSVAIQADEKLFSMYQSGVFDAQCGTELDHAVLLVGYGVEGDQEYWIMKNSWGTSWGESGYMKMV